MPNVQLTGQKTNYYAKILDIEAKSLITSDCNKFTGELLHTKRKDKGLCDKSKVSGS